MRDKKQQMKSVKMRDYSKFSADSFAKDLLEVDWDRMIANGANCPDKLFSRFYNKYNKIVNKHAPFKRLSNRKAKQLSKPWITTGIKASIAVKSKLYASGDDSRYKYYRNKICSLIWLSKKRYYYEYFEHNVTNMKKTWEGINELLYRRKRNFKNITQLKDRGNIVKEASEIPNILNKHFASVGTRLASKLPTGARFMKANLA